MNPTPQIAAVEDRILGAQTVREILFILVNESRQAVPYEIGCFIPASTSSLKLTISSVADTDRNAPFSQFLHAVYKQVAAEEKIPIQLLKPDKLPAKLRSEWSQWLPGHVLLCPLELDEPGFLLLGRTGEWTNPEALTVQRICRLATAMLKALDRPGLFTRMQRALHFSPGWIIAAILLVIAFFPVHSAILGMGEVVPLDPIVVRAPVDGIVDHMTVRPFEMVTPGTPLVLYEQLKIDNQLIVAKETLMGAEEALRQAKQGALFMADSSLRLPELEVKREEARAELKYLQELKSRMGVIAAAPGVALIDDYPSWPGKSVTMGERLLTIADPAKIELKLWIPAGDAGLVTIDDDVQLYLTVTPNDPVVGKVRSVSYQPKESPKGVLAYETMVTITQTVPEIRIGYFGTGRVYGPKMPLAFYILRRPLAIMRIWLGI